MDFGKHRGTAIEDVPSSYLDWVLENVDRISERFREAIEKELERRQNPPAPEPKRAPDGAFVKREIAKEIVQAGRRVLAKTYHPDLGGDVTKMRGVNASADWLESILESAPIAGVRR